MALWALILVSHVLHRDTLRGLGLGRSGFRASAQWVLPLAILLYLPLLFYGFRTPPLCSSARPGNLLFSLLGYGCWCAFQQYLTQSYFHNRLMLVIRNRHVSSALVGIMFSATHIPNLILMVATWLRELSLRKCSPAIATSGPWRWRRRWAGFSLPPSLRMRSFITCAWGRGISFMGSGRERRQRAVGRKQ